jgi:RNA polymerase sigma factor (sigma-70 family)
MEMPMEPSIEINDDLIVKWEPKVQKLASSVFVLDMDRDDIAQELRIAILKAAKGFNPDVGTTFHTYLHTTMMNTLRTLIVRAQRKHVDTQSIEDMLEVGIDDVPSNKIQQALGTMDDTFDDVEMMELIQDSNLTKKEEHFVVLRLEGLTMEEITEDLHESAYTIRAALREKVNALFEGEDSYEYGKEGESYRRI